ncbi:MAG: hypothetical protein KF729_39260 [Sandaracinaceae bacterium]|nr:hypothetical protein [Sandaracinaceae bacterium]
MDAETIVAIVSAVAAVASAVAAGASVAYARQSEGRAARAERLADAAEKRAAASDARAIEAHEEWRAQRDRDAERREAETIAASWLREARQGADDVRKVPSTEAEHAAAELLAARGRATIDRATTTQPDGTPGEPVLVCTLRYVQMVIREHGIDTSAFGHR